MLTLQAPGVEPFLPLGYGEAFTLTNISETSNNVTAGNDVIDYNAVLKATFYMTPALTTVAANVQLTGDFEVTLFGRTSPFETGTFAYQIDSISFSGIVKGHVLTAGLNSAFVSEGTTTIVPGPGVGQFTITAPGVLFGERSVDGGPPVAGPPYTVTVGPAPSAVPEPGLCQLAGAIGAGGLLVWRRTRLRRDAA